MFANFTPGIEHFETHEKTSLVSLPYSCRLIAFSFVREHSSFPLPPCCIPQKKGRPLGALSCDAIAKARIGLSTAFLCVFLRRVAFVGLFLLHWTSCDAGTHSTFSLDIVFCCAFFLWGLGLIFGRVPGSCISTSLMLSKSGFAPPSSPPYLPLSSLSECGGVGGWLHDAVLIIDVPFASAPLLVDIGDSKSSGGGGTIVPPPSFSFELVFSLS